MKLLTALLSVSIAGLAYARPSRAPVYYFDQATQPSTKVNPDAVTPQHAKLLLAHRLRLSQHQSLQAADELTLQLLNSVGAAQKPLFADIEEDDSLRRFLVIVEGVDSPEEFLSPQLAPAFTITNPPPSSSNTELIYSFTGHGGQGGYGSETGNLDYNQVLSSISSPWNIMFQVSNLEIIARREGINSEGYEQAKVETKQMLNSFITATNLECTIVIMPFASKKIETKNAYGLSGGKMASRQTAEEPLSVASQPSSPSPPKSHSSEPQTAKESSTRLKTTLPFCYSTLDACNGDTNQCSGRGKCFLKYNGSDEGSDKKCWSCKCSPQPTSGEGENGTAGTTHWGGAACQKQDVSAPFFLLAGFTIAMAAVVVWGIGLMYSIGEEDLPSVLGAGVTGPRATK